MFIGRWFRSAYLSIPALVAGLAIGIVVPWAESGIAPLLELARAIGGLWMAALRMTVLPLVVALVITAVASASSLDNLGKLGGRTLLWFLLLLGGFTVVTIAVAPMLFGALAVDPATSAALRANASVPDGKAQLPALGEWLVGLLPANPIAAAAQGEILPLVFFSVIFAAALTQVGPRLRDPLLFFFEGVKEVMLVVVRWVILLAPIGVFALAVMLGAQGGLRIAGAIGFYLLILCGLVIFAILLMYPVALFWGRLRLDTFAKAALPAQAIALGTRSSLASLPAMIQGARDRLQAPTSVTGLVLPLSAAMFKPAAPINLIVGAVFVAHLYGIELDTAELGFVAAMSIALSFSVPGIPIGNPALKAAVFAAVGLPVEGIAILLAVDVIPDLFRTTLNVTAPMAIVAVVSRERGTPKLTSARARARVAGK